MVYDFKSIEKKWQDKWEKDKVFRVEEDSKKVPYYVLEMFPYPSGHGLHMGHAFNYVIGDIFARFKRMQGFNVLHPMGYDALGLPAENAAIKEGTHPSEYTEKAIKNYIKQQKNLGISYDWSRMLSTTDPGYYKWDQWIFLKMLEKGLAYRKKSGVNWCPKCNTVLANEQVQDGKCWRHDDTDVEVKYLDQWYFKTTAYADELYEKIDSLNWPERTKAMQKNWIGKSEGTEVEFEVENSEGSKEKWPVFTTRADTIFGVTFLVVSAQHPKLMELVSKEQKKEVEKFLKKLKGVSEKQLETLDKEGIFTGSYAINPMNGEKVPIWAGNFVVADYGSGMVMAVPAHDQRDFEFAQKYEIPIKQVIAPLFSEKGKDSIKEDKETVERDSVFGIVKHWKEDKYYVLDWEKFGWKSFVIGGVEKGETPEQAVEREVKEETGYQDIKSIKKIGFENHSEYYAHHKDVNRYGKFNAFLVELKSDKFSEPDQEEVKNHKGKWLDKNEVSKFISLSNNRYIWDVYTRGEKAFTDYGVLINSPSKKPIRSYLMGAEKISDDDLEKLGIKIVEKTNNGDRKIEIPKECASNYERLIEEKLSKGFWNEYIGDEIVFIFKHKDGRIERLILNEKNEEKIDKLAAEFVGEDWSKTNPLEWLAENPFYTDLINRDKFPDFNGLKSAEAIKHIQKYLEDKKLGKKTVNFKLRDWLISRQRYWGTPIPVVYCDDCGIQGVKEKDLPVELPKKVKFGEGNPLTTNKDWIKAPCPKCGKPGKRETDTMDTFVNSSWYFLRYCDPGNDKKIFEKKKVDYWNPIDLYIGGAEHACMHLIYVRFYTKFLRDLGILDFDEPAKKLFHQGMLRGEGGVKISKSKPETVILPETVSDKYGIDTARFFLMGVASPDKDIDWSEKGVEGALRFIKKIFDYVENVKIGKSSARIEHKVNKAIKGVSENIEMLEYNFAVIKIREMFDSIIEEREISSKDLENAIKLLSPFCPHICEEIWAKIKGKGYVSLASWPNLDESKINEEIEKQEKAVEKLSEDINNVVRLLKEKSGKEANKVYVYVLPNEKNVYVSGKDTIKKKTGLEIELYAVNDSDKYDPEGKSKKVKPGKPGIYLE